LLDALVNRPDRLSSGPLNQLATVGLCNPAAHAGAELGIFFDQT
jgi:hypothetical protein